MDTGEIAILIGACALFFLVLFIIVWLIKYCKWCRNSDDYDSLLLNQKESNGNYSSMSYENQDIGLVDFVKQEKETKLAETREAAFVYLQFYLRSNPNDNYELIKHLPCIGNKINKNWFLMKRNEFDLRLAKQIGKVKLITLLKNQAGSSLKLFKNKTKEKQLKILTTVQQVKLLNELFVSLKHPFVLNFDLIHINFEQNYTLFIQDYSKDGSLKDLIYNTNPAKGYNEKYQYKSKGLPMKNIREFTKQIVQALVYFKFKMIPPLAGFHTGNIILGNDKQTCLVAGYESIFVEIKSRISLLLEKSSKKLSKYQFVPFNNVNYDSKLLDFYQNKYKTESVFEIIAFGHVFYEMAAGCELSDTFPLPKDYARIKSIHNYQDSEDILRFLNFIFCNDYSPTNEVSVKAGLYVPFVFQIDSNEFLSSVKLNALGNSEFNNLTQSTAIKDFIEFVMKKNRELSNKKLIKKESSKNDFKETSFQPSFTTTSVVAPTPPPPPPAQPSITTVQSVPTPPGPPPPPPPQFEIPQESDSSDRSALLGDIRKGMKLKKAVTVDKSKPKF